MKIFAPKMWKVLKDRPCLGIYRSRHVSATNYLGQLKLFLFIISAENGAAEIENYLGQLKLTVTLTEQAEI